MPQFGAIGVSAPGSVGSTAAGSAQIFPSPSIWGSCDGSSLNDNPDGFFISKFFKDDVTLPGLPSQGGTYTYKSSTDSALNVALDSTAIVAVFSKPMAPIAPNGANKLWFEVSINPLQSTNQQIFVGLATSTGLSSTVIATSTTLLASTGLIGFFLHGDAPTNFDAVYQNSSTLAGSTVVVLASTLTAGANNPDPGNPLYVPAKAPGALTGVQGFIKLGVKVDKTYAYWFVNGNLIAKQQIDATFETTKSYGGVIALGSLGTASANHVFSFYRTAARFG